MSIWILLSRLRLYPTTQPINELDEYLQQPLEKVDDALKSGWSVQQKKYPNLSRSHMALDYLSAPVEPMNGHCFHKHDNFYTSHTTGCLQLPFARFLMPFVYTSKYYMTRGSVKILRYTANTVHTRRTGGSVYTRTVYLRVRVRYGPAGSPVL
ncbi:uncharacterized protein HD556DRAFT_267004 [Suillus plorans]|uniref:Uncharacterized protein n=1 Tax=Suillus plorans TaxID=116603 RepID=A0A9P7DKE9_9AGAM|nr:uncharacterized protein HD556DRAFT_267004 [Suillus plorans]KAG1797005.1 hypothetical protein HD556DRAFT_267004 [Suillus plorans]